MSDRATKASINPYLLDLPISSLERLLDWAQYGGDGILTRRVLGTDKPSPRIIGGKLPNVVHAFFNAIDDIPEDEEPIAILLADSPDSREACEAAALLEEAGFFVQDIQIWHVGTSRDLALVVNAELQTRKGREFARSCSETPEFPLRAFPKAEFQPGEFHTLGGLLIRWADNVWAWSDHTRAVGVRDKQLSDQFIFQPFKCSFGDYFRVPVEIVAKHPCLHWIRDGDFSTVGNPFPGVPESDDGSIAFFLVPSAQFNDWADRHLFGAQWDTEFDAVIDQKIGELLARREVNELPQAV